MLQIPIEVRSLRHEDKERECAIKKTREEIQHKESAPPRPPPRNWLCRLFPSILKGKEAPNIPFGGVLAEFFMFIPFFGS